jgi:uncharacterized protein (DUF427 family)
MSLTTASGPLTAATPSFANYEIEGPPSQVFFEPVTRRVRGIVGGKIIVDSDNAMLLHETGTMVTVYFPVSDVAIEYFNKTDRSTRCPFKGDASYWSVNVDGQTRENVMWGYEDPIQSTPWLKGYVAFYWNAMDSWYDEDTEVFGHFRDPYHRVDARPSSRQVTITINGETVAESGSALVVSETGMPNRYYIPAADVRTELFTSTDSSTHCPYKGQAEYRALASDASDNDVAWIYSEPFDESTRLGGRWAFYDSAAEIMLTDKG